MQGEIRCVERWDARGGGMGDGVQGEMGWSLVICREKWDVGWEMRCVERWGAGSDGIQGGYRMMGEIGYGGDGMRGEEKGCRRCWDAGGVGMQGEMGCGG